MSLWSELFSENTTTVDRRNTFYVYMFLVDIYLRYIRAENRYIHKGDLKNNSI